MRDYLHSLYGANPVVVAGPCSAESEGQVLETAHALSALDLKVFRAGLWKPRTHPGGFEGVGATGLPWLQRVKHETGMLVATEVSPHLCRAALSPSQLSRPFPAARPLFSMESRELQQAWLVTDPLP